MWAGFGTLLLLPQPSPLGQVITRTPNRRLAEQLGSLYRCGTESIWPPTCSCREAEGRWPTRTGSHALQSQGFRHGELPVSSRSAVMPCVIEDVRGRYASQGLFGNYQEEGPDGNDTINWIAEQPWSNGRVAMAGSSYLGMVQWWAAIRGQSAPDHDFSHVFRR